MHNIYVKQRKEGDFGVFRSGARVAITNTEEVALLLAHALTEMQKSADVGPPATPKEWGYRDRACLNAFQKWFNIDPRTGTMGLLGEVAFTEASVSSPYERLQRDIARMTIQVQNIARSEAVMGIDKTLLTFPKSARREQLRVLVRLKHEANLSLYGLLALPMPVLVVDDSYPHFHTPRGYAVTMDPDKKTRCEIRIPRKYFEASRDRQEAVMRHEMGHVIAGYLGFLKLPYQELLADGLAHFFFGDQIHYDEDDVQTLASGPTRPQRLGW